MTANTFLPYRDRQLMADARRREADQTQAVEDQLRRKALAWRGWAPTHDAEVVKRNNAMLKGIITYGRNALGSWGISVPIKANLTRGDLMAFTDFKSITIQYPEAQVPVFDPLQGRNTTPDGSRLGDWIASVLGLLYHEGGHILHTIPLEEMWAAARMTKALRAWEQDTDPNKGIEFGSLTGVPRALEQYTPAGFPAHVNQLIHKVWNILEDQRMEVAVCRTSPVVGVYLTHTVLLNIIEDRLEDPDLMGLLGLYISTVGRVYLPSELRRQIRDVLLATNVAEGSPLDVATDIIAKRDIIAHYIGATTAEELADAVLDFIDNLPQSGDIGDNLDEHGDPGSPATPGNGRQVVVMVSQANAKADESSSDITGGGTPGEADGDFDGDEQDGQGGSKPGDEDGEGQDGEGSGDGEGDSEGEGSGQGDSSGDTGKGQGSKPEKGDSSDGSKGEAHDLDGNGTPGDGYGTGTAEPQDAGEQVDMLRKSIDEVLADLRDQEMFGHDVQTFSSMATDVIDAEGIPQLYDCDLLSESAQADAQALVVDLMNAFTPLLSLKSPSWQSRQTEGIVDPLAYRTKHPGEREFYRAYVGQDEYGSDISVTLILDVSGSMDHYIEALSIVSFAVGIVCDRLGVDFDSYVFGSHSMRLSRSGEVEPLMAPNLGYTDPTQALQWSAEREIETEHHLVLVMTDGQFGGLDASEYVKPGTHLLGCGFSQDEGQAQAIAETMINQHGFSDAFGCTDLKAVAIAVNDYLRQVI